MSDQATPTQPRTQRFYCPGCREWHTAPSLLEAVRREGERMRLETKLNEGSDMENTTEQIQIEDDQRCSECGSTEAGSCFYCKTD